MKVATDILEASQIKKVRVHGVPRVTMMKPSEVRSIPAGTQKLTIFREVLEGGKLGRIRHRQDEVDAEVSSDLPTKWVGASIFFEPLADIDYDIKLRE